MKQILFILAALLVMLPSIASAINDEGTKITLEPDEWMSFCSSVNIDARPWYEGTDKVKAYYMSGFNATIAKFVQLRFIPKGWGVVLHNEGNESVTVTVQTCTEQQAYNSSSNYLIGVSTDTRIQRVVSTGTHAPYYNYYLSTSTVDSKDYGLFRVPDDGITIPAGKAYCQLWASEEADLEKYASSNAKIGIEIIDDPETTGINEVKNEEESVNNQNVYDLSGRLVGTSLKGLKPGLYILNNRKVVVR